MIFCAKQTAAKQRKSRFLLRFTEFYSGCYIQYLFYSIRSFSFVLIEETIKSINSTQQHIHTATHTHLLRHALSLSVYLFCSHLHTNTWNLYSYNLLMNFYFLVFFLFNFKKKRRWFTEIVVITLPFSLFTPLSPNIFHSFNRFRFVRIIVLFFVFFYCCHCSLLMLLYVGIPTLYNRKAITNISNLDDQTTSKQNVE